MNHEEIAKKLQFPSGKLRCVIDTDAYNEVDDQFAIAWALRATERFDVEAIYAAPYYTSIFQQVLPIPDQVLKSMLHFAGTPGEGMLNSYHEIQKLLGILEVKTEVFKGSERFIGNDGAPVESEAARDLVKRAMSSTDTLYVLAIGAITNVASALLMEPSIRDRIVIVWLGGQPTSFDKATEFNLMQDVTASRHVFYCGVPLIFIPCICVASHLTVTREELEKRLIGKSKIGDYLGNIVLEQFKDDQVPTTARLMKKLYLGGMDDIPDETADGYATRHISWSRIVWDISTVGFLSNPDWSASRLEPSPVLGDDMSWSRDDTRHPVRVCHYLSREYIFGALFDALSRK